MSFRIEVLPFLAISLGLGIAIVFVLRALRVQWAKSAWSGGIVAVILSLYMLYFFRDPERIPPSDPSVIIAAADGKVAKISDISGDEFVRISRKSGLSDSDLALMDRLCKADSVRISIFLSLIDVHVNRAPIAGTSSFLGYFPGKRLFTFDDKSSEENQHNAIFIQNAKTCCLVNQIVGPVARRVVYWPAQKAELKMGDRFGMMKFGSRLDMYFPKGDITVRVKEGDRVAAGTSVIAVLRQGE